MKRFPFIATLAAAVCILMIAPSAHSTTLTFTANLVGSLEVPSSGSPATGSATFVIDTTANTLKVTETFSGLEAGTTASHIHCCLASAFLTGANAGVATQVPSFTGLPLGVTSGSFTQTLDLTSAASYNPAFVSAEGGTVAGAEAALIAGVVAGESYVNIHTSMFPGGEIRGFLTPTPEPVSLLLVGSGLAGVLGIRRRGV